MKRPVAPAPELPGYTLIRLLGGGGFTPERLQIAYSELFFTERLWPDFDRPDLEDAIEAYAGRRRRYGGR